MKIYTKQLGQEVFKNNFDLAVFTSGYEPRSTYLFSKGIKANKEIVLGFESFNDHNTRKLNDAFFKSKKKVITQADGNNPKAVNDILGNFLKSVNKESISIFIDYSSMTRVWYAEVLSFFRNHNSEHKNVKITFGYSFASYQPPAEHSSRNLYVSPIEGFSYFSVPNKPTALIIGLGYEKNKAFGLTEYFDAETFLFYNLDSSDKRFAAEIEKINFDLIEQTPEQNIFQYPINDLEYTERQLFSLCSYLKESFRVIVAPSGPKPFTLVSLVVALKMNEVDVWRISQGDSRNAVQYKASGKVSLYHVIFDYSE